MSKPRSSRWPGAGADWARWMCLAGSTNFNLIGGHGGAPEVSNADRSLALAQGTRDPLARALAFAVATMSAGAWEDVARLGTQRLLTAMRQDRRVAVILGSDERAAKRSFTAFRHAFSDMAAAREWPRYRRGARMARMRLENYITLYDATRAWLQVLADEAAADGAKQLRTATTEALPNTGDKPRERSAAK